jgi:MFS family permease
MITSGPKPVQRLFYGWIVVAAAFGITFFGFGSAYTFGAFVQPLESAFGASRGSVSLVFSLAGFLYFGFGLISGPLADRWGARKLAVIGMVLIAAGLMLAAMARSLLEVYAAYALGMGLGIGCAYVPAMGAVQRWFRRRRGLASGLAVSGIGVGTLVYPPCASYLIEVAGWRGAYLLLGAAAAFGGVGAALLIKSDPREMGIGPEGEAMVAAGNRDGMSLRDAVRSPVFMALYASCLLCAFGLFIPFAHLVPFGVQQGLSQSSAVLLIGIIGAGSTIGRFVLGSLADRIGRRPSLVGMLAGMAVAMLIWIGSSGLWSLAAFAFFFGVFYGGWVALLPALVMDEFGARNVSAIIGVLYTSVALGTLVGPTAAGYAYDLEHSYNLPIAASVAVNVAAAAIMLVAFRSRATGDSTARTS